MDKCLRSKHGRKKAMNKEHKEEDERASSRK